jgi:hypothetical protein
VADPAGDIRAETDETTPFKILRAEVARVAEPGTPFFK